MKTIEVAIKVLDGSPNFGREVAYCKTTVMSKASSQVDLESDMANAITVVRNEAACQLATNLADSPDN